MTKVVMSRTFRSGNSEAVRLPKEIAFGPDVEVMIERSGDTLTIRPRRLSNRDLVAKLRSLPGTGEIEVRDVEEIPERPGL